MLIFFYIRILIFDLIISLKTWKKCFLRALSSWSCYSYRCKIDHWFYLLHFIFNLFIYFFHFFLKIYIFILFLLRFSSFITFFWNLINFNFTWEINRTTLWNLLSVNKWLECLFYTLSCSIIWPNVCFEGVTCIYANSYFEIKKDHPFSNITSGFI